MVATTWCCFESVGNGVQISTSNTASTADGSRALAAAPTVPTGGTLVADNAHAHTGTLSLKVATSTTAGAVYGRWDTDNVATLYVRCYLYMTAAPSANRTVCQVLDNAGTVAACGIQITTSGQVRALGRDGVTIFTFAGAIAYNQWVRIEAKFVSNASTGSAEVKYWATADSTGTPTTSQTSSATYNTGAGSLARVLWGNYVSTASVSPYWLDDVGASTVGYLGPHLNTTITPASVYVEVAVHRPFMRMWSPAEVIKPPRPPEYRYLAFDALSGRLMAELPLSGVSFSWARDGGGAFSGAISIYDPKCVREIIRPQQTYLGVERNGALIWVGMLWGPSRSGDTITLPATEVVSMLSHRYIRQRLQYANTDRATIAKALVVYAQQGSGGNLAIKTGPELTGQLASVGWNFWDKKKVLDAINDLAAPTVSDTGFDYRVEPSWAMGNYLVLTFRVIYPKRSRVTTYVLEYGSNVNEYGWQQASPAVNFVDAFGDGAEQATRRASAFDDAILADTARVEGVYEFSDCRSQTLLQEKADTTCKELKHSYDQPSVSLVNTDVPQVGDLFPEDVVEVRIDDGFVQIADRYVIDKIDVKVDGGNETMDISFVFDDDKAV